MDRGSDGETDGRDGVSLLTVETGGVAAMLLAAQAGGYVLAEAAPPCASIELACPSMY